MITQRNLDGEFKQESALLSLTVNLDIKDRRVLIIESKNVK